MAVFERAWRHVFRAGAGDCTGVFQPIDILERDRMIREANGAGPLATMLSLLEASLVRVDGMTVQDEDGGLHDLFWPDDRAEMLRLLRTDGPGITQAIEAYNAHTSGRRAEGNSTEPSGSP